MTTRKADLLPENEVGCQDGENHDPSDQPRLHFEHQHRGKRQSNQDEVNEPD
jgi:hypothetical protein